jgi:glycosyltransferase involved in cell wall biosynthesis
MADRFLQLHRGGDVLTGLDALSGRSLDRGTPGGPAPVLSITMPTRNRAALFERALGSVIKATASVAKHIEITVSDGSDDDATGKVAERLLATWPGRYRYIWNRPALALVENLNRAIELATGDWIQQLHDDDYLLPEAAAEMLEAVRRTGPDERVLLFGVQIVDSDGIAMRERSFRQERYLQPREALRHLLRNSSFVRHPAMVVHRFAFERTGLFDTSVGEATDTDMWVRLFSRYGVRCLPPITCAYTIHQGATTDGMWNPGTIRAAQKIFDRAVAMQLVPEPTIRRWQADFVHQLILAGAYRRLRVRRMADGRDVLRLFELPEVRRLGISPKWLPVRAALVAATAGARLRGERRRSEAPEG